MRMEDMGVAGGLEPREFQLILLGTSTVKQGSSVRMLKRNQQPLLRGESPDFVNLLLCQDAAKLASPHNS